MTTTYNDKPANVAALAAAIPLPNVVAHAWIRAEGQAVANPTNLLNCRYYGRPGQLKGPGATGAAGVGFAAYKSVAAGVADTAWLLHTSTYYAGIRAVLGQSPLVIAHAIEASPWSAGHYGAKNGRDGSIARAVRAAQAPAPVPTPLKYKVQPGDTLSSIAGKVWHDTSLWPLIYSVNAAALSADFQATLDDHQLHLQHTNDPTFQASLDAHQLHIQHLTITGNLLHVGAILTIPAK